MSVGGPEAVAAGLQQPNNAFAHGRGGEGAAISSGVAYDPTPAPPAGDSVAGFTGAQPQGQHQQSYTNSGAAAVASGIQNIHIHDGGTGGQPQPSDGSGAGGALPTQQGLEQNGGDSSSLSLGSRAEAIYMLADQLLLGVGAHPAVNGTASLQEQHQAGVQGPSGARVPLVGCWQSRSDIPHRMKIFTKIMTFLQAKPQARPEWLAKVPQMGRRLEDALYRSASSFDEHHDPTTLMERLQHLALRLGNKAKQEKLQGDLLQEQGVESVASTVQGDNGQSKQVCTQSSTRENQKLATVKAVRLENINEY